MTISEIEEVVKLACKTTRRLRIHKYRSESGSVSTKDVEIMPKGGYLELIHQSKAALEKLEQPKGMPSDVFISAKVELGTSFNRSLNEEHAPRNYKEALASTEEGYAVKAADHKTGAQRIIVLTGLRSLHEEYFVGAPSKISKDPVVRAKGELSALLPVSKFIGRLNLAPDKLDFVEVIHD